MKKKITDFGIIVSIVILIIACMMLAFSEPVESDDFKTFVAQLAATKIGAIACGLTALWLSGQISIRATKCDAENIEEITTK
jgi:ribose/xylose/arabinose/galactoside ABC-type transport system permease subunit